MATQGKKNLLKSEKRGKVNPPSPHALGNFYSRVERVTDTVEVMFLHLHLVCVCMLAVCVYVCVARVCESASEREGERKDLYTNKLNEC